MNPLDKRQRKRLSHAAKRAASPDEVENVRDRATAVAAHNARLLEKRLRFVEQFGRATSVRGLISGCTERRMDIGRTASEARRAILTRAYESARAGHTTPIDRSVAGGTLLVGEAANGYAIPAHSDTVEYRLSHGAFEWGVSRDRLIRLGLQWDAAINLLPQGPTVGYRWDADWALRVAHATYEWAIADARGPWGLVLCGAHVARAFGLIYRPPLRTEVDVDGTRVDVLVIPHPSGRCTYWNDEENCERVREEFKRWRERSSSSGSGR